MFLLDLYKACCLNYLNINSIIFVNISVKSMKHSTGQCEFRPPSSGFFLYYNWVYLYFWLATR